MLEEIIKYLTVYSISALKFVFGPTLGLAYGFNVFTTGTLTLLGAMTSVYVFTFFGDQIKNLMSRIFKAKKKNIFSKNNRRFVVIWKKYGIMGIAFLTPIFLTPIGGTITANALGCKKEDIFKYMWISSLFWSYTITWLLKFAKDYLFFI